MVNYRDPKSISDFVEVGGGTNIQALGCEELINTVVTKISHRETVKLWSSQVPLGLDRCRFSVAMAKQHDITDRFDGEPVALLPNREFVPVMKESALVFDLGFDERAGAGIEGNVAASTLHRRSGRMNSEGQDSIKTRKAGVTYTRSVSGSFRV